MKRNCVICRGQLVLLKEVQVKQSRYRPRVTKRVGVVRVVKCGRLGRAGYVDRVVGTPF